MSFVWKRPEGRLKSPEQVAKECLEVAYARQLDDFAAVLAVMCIAQESDFWCPWNRKDDSSHNYPFDSESDDGRSVGYFQQQNGVSGENPPAGQNWWGTMASRMDLKRSCDVFLTRLADDYGTANGNAQAANDFIQRVQRSGVPNAYAKHYGRAWDLVNSVKGQANQPTDPIPPVIPGGTVPGRPDFNEINEIDLDSNGSGGYNHASPRSRPPINWFLHTQQGKGNATDLSAFLRSTSGNKAVSYHYTIHEDPNDHGVTVVDVVDTDWYSWSVLNANVFSINACFAGSFVEFSRDEWLANYRNAIRVAAWLAVQDCKKYSTLSSNVILPPYQSGAGISDHRYVTKCLGIGDHTDVGGPMNAPWVNFPWDVFVDDVHEFNGVPTDAPPVGLPPAANLTDRQLLERIADDAHETRKQLSPEGDPSWKNKGHSVRDLTYAMAKAVGVPDLGTVAVTRKKKTQG